MQAKNQGTKGAGLMGLGCLLFIFGPIIFIALALVVMYVLSVVMH